MRYLLFSILGVCLLCAASCNSPSPVEPASPVSISNKSISKADNTEVVTIPADSALLKRIKVETVISMKLPLDEVVAPGKIETNPNRISKIAMPVPGRIKRVLVGIGDSVEQDQPIFTIESPEISSATSSYRQAIARVGQTKVALTKAEADLSRLQELFANRAVAQKEVFNAQAVLAQAKSDVEQGQAQLEEGQRRFTILGLTAGVPNQEVVVRAPLSGKILEINVTAGEYRNDTSAPLMTIADLSILYMAADVPETQIRLITKNEAVKISLSAYAGELFLGRVTRIADTVDAATRTIKVRAELKNSSGRFRPDMFGEMRHEESFREVPVVPAGAIIQSDKNSIVWREKSAGVFEPVPVTFSKQNEGRVPVLSGLSAGDRIVTNGAMLLTGNR